MSRATRALCAAGGAALVTLLSLVTVTVTVPGAMAAAPAGRAQRVSVAADGAQGDGDSMAPSVSSDGRYVAFESDATNLVPGDTNGLRDVYRKDMRTGRIVRVTAQGAGAPAGAEAYQPSLSADGRYVAFTSEWPYPVHSGPPGRQSDVYVRDLRTGRTAKVNLGLDDGFGIVSRDPSISADGRYVAFVAGVEPWFPLSLHGDVRVYVRDLKTGTTRRVSAAAGPDGDREAVEPHITPDGSAVAYSTNVPHVSGPPVGYVYAWRRATGGAERVDVTYDGSGTSPKPSRLAGISPDGRYVLFNSPSDRMVLSARHTGGYLRDLGTHSTRTVDAPGDPTAPTRAGAFLGTTRDYVLAAGGQEYVRDVRTGRTRRLPADDAGMNALVYDWHARVAAFQSWKDDWVPGDTNDRGDVFLVRLR
ncbi:TolB family protein [Streptomyces sp. NPDC050287]|uniref:TolB family protein n=1 Tax=Streptomyces sp. NPDC050287 TaxID=3365608 RepID=UPI0037BB1AE3